MKKSKKLILFGESAFGEIAYELFTNDSEYEVVAFTVSQEFIKKETLFGLPIIPFEQIEEHYPPDNFEMHIALVYNSLNRTRANFYYEAKKKGYKLANYISSRAFVWPNVTMGDNVFIFENNTVQPFVKMNSNIVLWSGNHIGHHSVLGSHLFISSHVVISGFCSIGDYTFMGVNSTVGNNINIGKDCLIGSGCLIVKDTGDGKLFKGTASKPDELSVYDKFQIK
jgi:sugar O-acyltransferase (sialic acid O-acetyltransferase NeuD family)